MRHLNSVLPGFFPLRSPSLATALLLVLLLPLLGITALSAWYGIALLERHTQARMQQDIELVARAIRLPLSHAMERGYQRTIQQALDSAFSIDRVYGAYVYDHDGNTIAASGFQSGSLASDKVARIAREGEQQSEFGRMAGEEVFSYFVPLTDGGGRISGLLQVTRHGSDFDDYLGQMRRKTLLVVLLSGLLLAAILLAAHRWAIGRHLLAIESGLQRIGQGDLSHRLRAGGVRELQHLADSINQMLDAIEHSRQQLGEMGARLHQAEKLAALGQLSAGVAHELGSPLSTVDGKAQRLLRREDLPTAARQALTAIRHEAARMERIIRQLLDFGRNNPLELRTIGADQPLRAVCERYRGVAGPSIQVDWGSASQERIRVDRIRLDQALDNLLRNARQAATHTVQVSVHCDNHWLSYCIDDDGAGIAPEHHPHLFEPFFTTKPVGQGTGLGLAVAHAAARDHGGEIQLDTSPLGGARFCLRLPRHSPQEHP
jgi:signal transduction histidine kinase